MTRVKRGNVARKRRKKVLKITEGFRGSSSLLFRTANQQKMKAFSYSYRDRHDRKGQFRSLWITRINAAMRLHGINYSHFIHTLKNENIVLNRKMIAQLAVRDQEALKCLVTPPNLG